MKNLTTLCYILFGALISLLISNINYNSKNKINIDLPEEYTEISHNPNKPDLLTGHISNDTLFIEFKN